MIDFDQISSAARLLPAYVKAEDLVKKFESTGQAKYAIHAAAILCSTLHEIEMDEKLWAALASIGNVPVSERAVILELANDVEALAAVEARIMEALGSQKEAEAAWLEFGAAAYAFDRWPDCHSVEGFRRGVGRVAESSCRRASRTGEPATKTSSVLRSGLEVAGGMVLAGCNAYGVTQSFASKVEGSASIIEGLGHVRRGVEQIHGRYRRW